jgi:hypothetical protein
MSAQSTGWEKSCSSCADMRLQPGEAYAGERVCVGSQWWRHTNLLRRCRV